MMLIIMLQMVNHLNITHDRHEARRTRPAPTDPGEDGNQPPRQTQPPILPLNTEVTIPLKYLSNFWRSLDLSLLSCEEEFDLKWSKNCVLIEEDYRCTCYNY